MLTSWRRARRTPDAGMTMTELLVGMTLLSIVGALTAGFFVTIARQTDRTTAADLNAADIRTAMNAVTTALRLADTPTANAGTSTGRFLTLTPSEAVFFSNLPLSGRSGTSSRVPPDKVDLVASGSKLIEYVYPPITAYTIYPLNYVYATNYRSTPSITTVLLSSLASTSVFSYCTDQTDPAVTCSPASTGDQVSSVGVTLTVAGATARSTQTLRSSVAITGLVT